MKKSIYAMMMGAIIYCSCNGGNIGPGVQNTSPDSAQGPGKKGPDTSVKRVDTSVAALPTDTAPYKRKFSKEDSMRLRTIDTSKNKSKK